MESTVCFQQLLKDQCAVIVDEVMKGMTDKKHLIKVGVNKNLPPHKPILYRWWFPAKFAKSLVSAYQQEMHDNEDVLANVEKRKIKGMEYYALYFGKSNNGWRRYNQHASKNVYSSTLRQTIYGLCIGNEYVEANELQVTKILNTCYCEWIDFSNEGNLIECIEGICIVLGNYPFNIEGNPSICDKWRKYIKNKRKIKNAR